MLQQSVATCAPDKPKSNVCRASRILRIKSRDIHDGPLFFETRQNPKQDDKKQEDKSKEDLSYKCILSKEPQYSHIFS